MPLITNSPGEKPAGKRFLNNGNAYEILLLPLSVRLDHLFGNAWFRVDCSTEIGLAPAVGVVNK